MYNKTLALYTCNLIEVFYICKAKYNYLSISALIHCKNLISIQFGPLPTDTTESVHSNWLLSQFEHPQQFWLQTPMSASLSNRTSVGTVALCSDSIYMVSTKHAVLPSCHSNASFFFCLTHVMIPSQLKHFISFFPFFSVPLFPSSY